MKIILSFALIAITSAYAAEPHPQWIAAAVRTGGLVVSQGARRVSTLGPSPCTRDRSELPDRLAPVHVRIAKQT
jgi:hypothetical protein